MGIHMALSSVLNPVVSPIKSFIERRRRKELVGAANSVAELTALADRKGFKYFTNYARNADKKQREFLAGVEAIGISLAGKTVFDIGPGTADSLDAAAKMGASKTWFIDEEPFFWRYATLKGHQGWMNNYTIKPYFPPELTGKVDFIWTKGSINCTQINEGQHGIERLKFMVKRFDLYAWIHALKDLLTPTGCILLMPAMGYQEQTVFDEVYGYPHHWWCPDVDAFLESHFARAFYAHSFSVIRDIPFYTQEKAFPVGFLYRMPGSYR